MQEYWVNVYEHTWFEYREKRMSFLEACLNSPKRGKCLYRIHVKMDGGWNNPFKVGGREIAKLIPDIYR